jgi:HK97 gp10 family phage protein
MAADFTIKTSGLEEAQKAIYSYGQQFGDFVVYKSLRAGANVVLREARANAPIKTGKLKKGIVIMKSRINNGKKSPLLGMTITIRKRKGDPFYGRFQEDGWNTRGRASEGLGGKFGKLVDRHFIVKRFGSNSGRKTQPGKTDVPGKKFIENAFTSKQGESVNMIVTTATAAADLLARRQGL